jgi:hypothetical protein
VKTRIFRLSSLFLKRRDELERVGVVGDAEIRPDLLAFDVPGIDAKEDVRLVFKLSDKPHLDVGVIPRQNPRGVVIVEELPAELEVELGEAVDSFKDFTCLFFDILFVIETLFLDHPFSPGLGIKVSSFTTIVKGFAKRKRGTSVTIGSSFWPPSATFSFVHPEGILSESFL